MLEVSNLSKSYKISHSQWKYFAHWFGFKSNSFSEKCVLKNVNFSMQAGEALGVIGCNGAGKSTLLQIIAGTIFPSSGHVHYQGHIAAILELGVGFHSELTGRQNAYHVASMNGFSGAELHNAIEQTFEFSEIGDYFDQPVRTYSSGMQMRVAFSVLTARRPDVLLVDEAFSVGDAYFQHKSFDRIRGLQKEGTCLILVSHDRNAIANICNRALLLENGNVAMDGKPEQVLDYYNATLSESSVHTIQAKPLKDGNFQVKSGTGEATLTEILLFDSCGKNTEILKVGEKVKLELRVRVFESVETLVLGFGIKDRMGQVLYGTNTWHTKQIIDNPKVGDEFMFTIEFEANFNVGNYSVQTALTDSETHLHANYEWLDYALVFEVINTNKPFFTGTQWNDSKIEIEKIT